MPERSICSFFYKPSRKGGYYPPALMNFFVQYICFDMMKIPLQYNNRIAHKTKMHQNLTWNLMHFICLIIILFSYNKYSKTADKILPR